MIDSEIVVGTRMTAVILDDIFKPFSGFVCFAEAELCQTELEHRLQIIRFKFQYLFKLPFGC